LRRAAAAVVAIVAVAIAEEGEEGEGEEGRTEKEEARLPFPTLAAAVVAISVPLLSNRMGGDRIELRPFGEERGDEMGERNAKEEEEEREEEGEERGEGETDGWSQGPVWQRRVQKWLPHGSGRLQTFPQRTSFLLHGWFFSSVCPHAHRFVTSS